MEPLKIISASMRTCENLGNLKANFNVNLNGVALAMQLVERKDGKGMFLGMPQEKGTDGKYYEKAGFTSSPAGQALRGALTQTALDMYKSLREAAEKDGVPVAATINGSKTKEEKEAEVAANIPDVKIYAVGDMNSPGKGGYIGKVDAIVGDALRLRGVSVFEKENGGKSFAFAENAKGFPIAAPVSVALHKAIKDVAEKIIPREIAKTHARNEYVRANEGMKIETQAPQKEAQPVI